MAQGKKYTKEDKERYKIAYFNNNGIMCRAAKEAGLGYDTARKLHRDPAFQKEIEEIQSNWVEELRSKGIERALKKSDILLIFFLKAFNPEIYDDKIRTKQYLDEIVDEAIKRLPRLEPNVIPKSENK